MNKMDCITVYLYIRHFLNITRDEEQRLKTFRILIRPLPGLHGLPTRSYIKCGLLTYPCGLSSMWAFVLWDFVLWAFVRVGFCPDTRYGTSQSTADLFDDVNYSINITVEPSIQSRIGSRSMLSD